VAHGVAEASIFFLKHRGLILLFNAIVLWRELELLEASENPKTPQFATGALAGPKPDTATK
jgi:hypothetical protein